MPVTILDSNIVIYLIAGRVAPPAAGIFGVSSVSQIECLGFAGLSEADRGALEQFFGSVEVVHPNDQIVGAAIDLRQQYRLRTPDALILTTALVCEGSLLSNDTTLSRVREVHVQSLPFT